MLRENIGKLAVTILIGISTGLGVFTFYFAEGISYFKTNPEKCANCHIMQPQLDSWRKSSHHTVALCIDCHLPHSFFSKYIAKAENGYFHSKGFTLQDFPEPIRIGRRNEKILEENCIRCHEPMVHDLERGVFCVHCHAGVGHGDIVGLGKSYE